jgi:hypothetical protein
MPSFGIGKCHGCDCGVVIVGYEKDGETHHLRFNKKECENLIKTSTEMLLLYDDGGLEEDELLILMGDKSEDDIKYEDLPKLAKLLYMRTYISIKKCKYEIMLIDALQKVNTKMTSGQTVITDDDKEYQFISLLVDKYNQLFHEDLENIEECIRYGAFNEDFYMKTANDMGEFRQAINYLFK